jgi:hypothetical protein
MIRAFLETMVVIVVGVAVGCVGIGASAAVLYGSVRLLLIVNCGVTLCR